MLKNIGVKRINVNSINSITFSEGRNVFTLNILDDQVRLHWNKITYTFRISMHNVDDDTVALIKDFLLM